MKKREELAAIALGARNQLKVIDAAIRILGDAPRPARQFERGQLMRMVCDAQRSGISGDMDIARVICGLQGWGDDPSLLTEVRLKVKDVTKRMRRKARDEAVRLNSEQLRIG